MKTTLISLAAILFSFSLKAQTVNIPDVNFKTYLVGESSINTNGDSEIDSTEAAVFNGSIDAIYKGIVDLTGIESFTALTKLNCYDNLLTSLDLSKNTALMELYCGGNKLTTLDFSKNTALTILKCSYNPLTSLNISKNAYKR